MGATLVGGFHPGGPHQIVGTQLGITWPIRSVEPAMQVHLPDRSTTRWSEANCWRDERVRVFGSQAEKFWSMQERVALIITSNLRFTDWTQAFGDERLTGALLDRLTHRAHIVGFIGESYRCRQRQ